MFILGSEQIKEADRKAIEETGIHPLAMMENAGRAVAVAAINNWNLHDCDEVLILAGKGNNGGDALVCARFLTNFGIKTNVFCVFDPSLFSKDAEIQYGILKRIGITLNELSVSNFKEKFEDSLFNSHLVIDGIFGTGFKGPVTGLPSVIIDSVNKAKKPVLSIDIPSGVNSDDGSVKGTAVRASITVTFACPKKGHFSISGKEHSGRIIVADIGLPGSIVEQLHDSELLTTDYVRKVIPARNDTWHKGQFGKILVVGGSACMPGAPFLAGKAAFKTGAGFVTLAVPSDIIGNPFGFEEATYFCANDGPYLTMKGAKRIIELSENYDAAVIGPGLGREKETASAAAEILLESKIPAVVDADALHAVVPFLKNVSGRKHTVLTPHLGEFSALTGLPTEEINKDPAGQVLRFAEKYSLTIHLKGPLGRVTCGSTLMTAVNPVMESALATAGSGDVLSGIIAALLGKTFDAFKSTGAGVFIHAVSGIIAREKFYAVTASDIYRSIPDAIKAVIENRDFGFIDTI
ncbi:NAD(P)H-hydrate dehydratase [candidate division WOR-3 bacterium]|nr:NAD(P)H-hydrate dehydratase [candidate division WOR-3 bacterium]